jgi:hypothetical protein
LLNKKYGCLITLKYGAYFALGAAVWPTLTLHRSIHIAEDTDEDEEENKKITTSPSPSSVFSPTTPLQPIKIIFLSSYHSSTVPPLHLHPHTKWANKNPNNPKNLQVFHSQYHFNQPHIHFTVQFQFIEYIHSPQTATDIIQEENFPNKPKFSCSWVFLIDY